MVTVVSNLVALPARPAHPPRLPPRMGQARRRAPSSCPVPLAVQFVLTLGLCLFLSALTVHFRDLQNILGHVLHLWFFATPVLYSLAEVPARLRAVLRLNPMAHVHRRLPADPLRGRVPAGPRAPRRRPRRRPRLRPRGVRLRAPARHASRRKCERDVERGRSGRRRPRRGQGLPAVRPPEPVQDPEERAPHGLAALRPPARPDLHRARRRDLRRGPGARPSGSSARTAPASRPS